MKAYLLKIQAKKHCRLSLAHDPASSSSSPDTLFLILSFDMIQTLSICTCVIINTSCCTWAFKKHASRLIIEAFFEDSSMPVVLPAPCASAKPEVKKGKGSLDTRQEGTGFRGPPQRSSSAWEGLQKPGFWFAPKALGDVLEARNCDLVIKPGAGRHVRFGSCTGMPELRFRGKSRYLEQYVAEEMEGSVREV